MGGFRFQGPNYIIINKPTKSGIRCKCIGFVCNIAEDIETFLVNKEDKTLCLKELPAKLASKMKHYHIGDVKEYDVLPREEKQTLNGRVVAGQKHIFSFTREYEEVSGFYFQGPNYIITNIPFDNEKCKCVQCMNNIRNIGQDVETLLVDKADKVLNVSNLPIELQFTMRNWNLGSSLEYNVIPRTEENTYNSKSVDSHIYSLSKFDAIGVDSYTAMFQPLNVV